ncbi:hypothetical protein BH23PLA1_BH23PLA1_04060 [soil metagenome]
MARSPRNASKGETTPGPSQSPGSEPSAPRYGRTDMAPRPPVAPPVPGQEIGVAIAASPDAGGGVVTARRAGGLRDVGMVVDPMSVGVPAALQNLAKAVNIAFQTDYGENYLEAVYQAAIVLKGEIRIVHKEYFGFGNNWFGQFGKLVRSLQLTLDGPDPASPEGQRRIAEKGPASIRGILNLIGRKLDIVAEYEDRVPAYVEQMFDRLEASGIIEGWERTDWEIRTNRIGLDIRILPAETIQAAIAEREASKKSPDPS